MGDFGDSREVSGRFRYFREISDIPGRVLRFGGDSEIPGRFRRFKRGFGDSWEISEIQGRFQGSDISGRFLRSQGGF